MAKRTPLSRPPRPPPRSRLSPRVRVKAPGQYHHGELRRALLDATLSIVGRDGTAALSLRAVARRVGVSAQASYNHFPDRAALLGAAAIEGLFELARRLREASAGGGSLRERFEAVGVAYVLFAGDHAAHFRLLSAPELGDLRGSTALAVAYDDAFGILLACIVDCQREGIVRSGDARALALSAWATVHGLAWLVVDGQLAVAGMPGDATEVTRIALRGLFQGLSVRS